MIAYLKCRLHGPRRYFKSLDDKGSDKKGDENGDDDRFRVLAKFGFCFGHE